MKIIKVNKERNILNEDGMSAGFTAYGYNTPGFSYSILPLLFNLCQPGNDAKPSENNKAYKYFVGDMVKGVCPYDKKKHKGIIKYLYYTVEDNESPLLVYIQDMDNNDTVPLKPDTVKKLVPPVPTSNVGTNYLGWGSSHVGYDMNGGSPNVVKESQLINFNNNDTNRFAKSDISLSHEEVFKQYTNFDLCKNGDIIYESELGINTIVGTPVAKCCIESGVIDDKAHFVCINQDLETRYLFLDDELHSKKINAVWHTWGVDYDGDEVIADWKNESYGWNDTNILLNNNSEIAIHAKSISSHCYIPSALELDTMYNRNEYSDYDIASSTFCESCSINYDGSIDEYSKLKCFFIHSNFGSKYGVLAEPLNAEMNAVIFYNPYIDNSIKESFDYNKALINFNDNNTFNKEKLKSNGLLLNEHIYDFLNCQVGTLLYYDDIVGFNLGKIGDLVGICCVPAGEIDEYPRFIYKEIIPNCVYGPADENYEILIKQIARIESYIYNNEKCGYFSTKKLAELNISDGARKVIQFGEDYIKGQLYIPSQLELSFALYYDIKNFVPDHNYMTSSYSVGGSASFKVPYVAIILDVDDDEYSDGLECAYEKFDYEIALAGSCNVIPFINILEIIKRNKNKKIHESTSFDFNKSLINFGNDNTFDKETLKSNELVLNEHIYDFLNCQVGDHLYYDSILGFNTGKIGEDCATCYAASGEIDEYPRFVYNKSSVEGVAFLLYRDDMTMSLMCEELELIAINKYINKNSGYKLTLHLAKQKLSDAAISVILDAPTYLKDFVYIPTTYELAYSIVNGIYNMDIIGTDYYLTASYFIEEENDGDEWTYVGWNDVVNISDFIGELYDVEEIMSDNGSNIMAFDDCYDCLIYIDILEIIKRLKDKEKINESETFDFNKTLMSFDTPNFDKSKIPTNKLVTNEYCYNFSLGNFLYYDETLGYNTLEGKKIAICVADAGQIDEYPRFACINELTDSVCFANDDNDIESITFDGVTPYAYLDDEKTEEITREFKLIYDDYYNVNCGYEITELLYYNTKHSEAAKKVKEHNNDIKNYLYIPTVIELALMFANGYRDMLVKNADYLTSTANIHVDYNGDGNNYIEPTTLITDDINITNCDVSQIIDECTSVERWDAYRCIPFFYINDIIDEYKIKKRINESTNYDFNKALIQFDDTHFEKTSSPSKESQFNVDNYNAYDFIKTYYDKFLYKSFYIGEVDNMYGIFSKNITHPDSYTLADTAISIIDNNMTIYLLAINNIGSIFNLDPFDIIDLINEYISKGFHFKKLILRHLNININDGYITLTYLKLIKLLLLPDEIENIIRIDENIQSYALHILPLNEKNLDNICQFDLNDCKKIAEWSNKVGFDDCIFFANSISPLIYKEIYYKNRTSNILIDQKILNKVKRKLSKCQSTSITKNRQRLCNIIEEHHILLKNYNNDIDVSLIEYYIILISYIYIISGVPFNKKSPNMVASQKVWLPVIPNINDLYIDMWALDIENLNVDDRIENTIIAILNQEVN